MIEDITDCYRILDLEPGATLAEVKISYRELVKVWHPDRFPNDPKFQKKGAEKLKQINAAYERICNYGSGHASRSSTSKKANSQQSAKNAHATKSTNSTDNRSNSEQEIPRQPSRPSPKTTSSPSQDKRRKFIPIAIAIGILFIIKLLFTSDDRTRHSTKDYSSPPSAQQTELIKLLPDNISHVSQEHTVVDSKQEPVEVSPSPTKPLPDSTFRDTPPNLESNVPILEPVNKQEPLSPIFDTKRSKYPSDNGDRFFTVGSTKDEVIAVRGTPYSSSETKFYYDGEGAVFFENDRVVGWDYVGLRPSRPFGAKLLPSAKVEPKEFFTLGSTKDEILAVQGTPTKFSDKTFEYNNSSITFTDGKVTAWYQHTSNPLKAKLLPSAPVVAKEFFELGSTMDEVLATQGTPTNIQRGSISTGDPSKTDFADTIFGYGRSFIHFKNGSVISWVNKTTKLKTRGPGNISDWGE